MRVFEPGQDSLSSMPERMITEKTNAQPTVDSGDENHGTDRSMSLARATVLSTVFIPFAAAIVFGLYIWIWGGQSLLHPMYRSHRMVLLLIALIVSIPVHESLHAAGYVWFGRVPWKSVRFGLNIRVMAAFIHCPAPIPASAYRKLTALPGIVLGIIPSIAGIAFGDGIATMYGFLMLIGAGGDFLILRTLRRVPPDARVLDHPTRAGCRVLSEKSDQCLPAENNKIHL